MVSGFGGSTVYGQNGAVSFKTELGTETLPLCGGEIVTFKGPAHFVLHHVFDSNGGEHDYVHLNFMHVVGFGTISGDKHEVTDTEHSSFYEGSHTAVFHANLHAALIQAGKQTNSENSIVKMEPQTVLLYHRIFILIFKMHYLDSL